MSLSPIPTIQKKVLSDLHRKESKRKLKPIKPAKSPEVKYRKQMQAMISRMSTQVMSEISTLLLQMESEYVKDAYARTLQEAFERLRKSYLRIEVLAQSIASDFVGSSDRVNKEKFYSAVEESIGVNVGAIIQKESLEDILVATTRENVSLIKSIPEEYFKKIESIVFSGTTQGRSAKSMMEKIRETGNVTQNRAKLIARDQSSKLNSALNEQRQRNLGVEEYIWRTSGDERVRDSHKSKNGKIFRWDSPPADTGHPGQDIQCRCVAQPIIKI